MTDAPHPLVVKARAALQRSDAPGAESAVLARLREAPGDTDALEIRVLLARQRGQTQAAETLLRQVVALPTPPSWAFEDLILLLADSGRRDEAQSVAQAALAANPVNAAAHHLLGSMLSEAGGLIEGETHLRRAMAIAGPHPQALANLALNLTTQGRLEEAGTLFRQVDAARALDPTGLAGWARLKEAGGDLDGAEALLARAEKTGADVRLSRAVLLTRRGRPAEALALIEAAGEAIGPDARLERGRLRDRLGRHAEAWKDFLDGKAQFLRRMPAYDAPAAERRFATLRAAFPAERLAALPAAPVRADLPQPVFILGFPRSGTTLIEQVLASHSAVRAGGELPFLADLEPIAAPRLPAPTQALGEELRDAYLARAEAYGLTRPGTRWFTDKMPLNDVWLPLIRMAFPASPVIRLTRHPLDVMVSMLSHHLTHGFGCGYRPEDIAHHLEAMAALSAHYDESLQAPPHALRYEDFVAAQEPETNRLLALLGLDLEPACLAFHQSRRYAPTPSYAQVTEPLNDRSIGRWKAYAEPLAPYAERLAPLIAAQGY